MDAESLIREYLRRLDAEARRVPPERRAELVGDVREHIDRALAETGSRDEAAVRTVLDRLGSPRSIVDAEAPPWPSTLATVDGTIVAVPAQRFGAVEIIGLLLLTLGPFVLPFVGPLAGLVFIWASPQWETRHKAIATAIVVGCAVVFWLTLTTFVMASPMPGGD